MTSWISHLLDSNNIAAATSSGAQSLVSSPSTHSMAGFLDRTPSLGRSDDSGADTTSIPPTPSDKSPAMYAQTYAIPPPLDASIALHPPLRAATPQPGQFAALPNIMDPATAASVPVRRLCCIGAGYVGESC